MASGAYYISKEQKSNVLYCREHSMTRATYRVVQDDHVQSFLQLPTPQGYVWVPTPCLCVKLQAGGRWMVDGSAAQLPDDCQAESPRIFGCPPCFLPRDIDRHVAHSYPPRVGRGHMMRVQPRGQIPTCHRERKPLTSTQGLRDMAERRHWH